jgi:hypothetical protein
MLGDNSHKLLIDNDITFEEYESYRVCNVYIRISS